VRRRPRCRCHRLVVRDRPALPSELEVPLVFAVQVGLDDVPSDLGRHDATPRATLCDLLATVLETTPRPGTSHACSSPLLGATRGPGCARWRAVEGENVAVLRSRS